MTVVAILTKVSQSVEPFLENHFYLVTFSYRD
jgi:hypothetical protein